jgi:hypothetical protein
MFSDPFILNRDWSTITANAGENTSLPASERAADHSTYRGLDPDQNDHILFIGHNYGRRNRFTARYTVSGFMPSATVPDQNVSFNQSVYVVADVPVTGPIQSTSTSTHIFRKQMHLIGGFLVSVGVSVDPLFSRIVNGET